MSGHVNGDAAIAAAQAARSDGALLRRIDGLAARAASEIGGTDQQRYEVRLAIKRALIELASEMQDREAVAMAQTARVLDMLDHATEQRQIGGGGA